MMKLQCLPCWTRFESLETTVAALETKIDNLTEMLQTLLDQEQS
jgi:hypothetical protein